MSPVVAGTFRASPDVRPKSGNAHQSGRSPTELNSWISRLGLMIWSVFSRHSRPQALPWKRRKQQRDDEERQAHAPPDALPCPRADFAHHELLAFAHFGIGFQERGNPLHRCLIEGFALRAAS